MTIRAEAGRAGGLRAVRTSVDGRRLGQVGARRFGIVFTVSAVVNLVVPALDRLPAFAPVLGGLAVMLAGFLALGRMGHDLVWMALVYFAGLATIGAFLLPGAGVIDGSTLAAVTMVASLAVPSLLVAVAGRRRLPVVAVVAVVAGMPVAAAAVIATLPYGRAAFVGVAVVGGWLALAFAGLWLDRSVLRVEAGLARLRQGYAAQRRSTEAEAELRYGARVLHDTVLATLSLIAHAGEGVSAAALRERAAADSVLLARLRREGTLAPEALPEPTRAAAPAFEEEPTRSAQALSVRALMGSRFEALGFAVVWHGVEGVDASVAGADALARAVSECLENARRHSGEPGAEVTLSQDERMVRAVVTDTGVGFDRALVPRERLGLAESVEERLRAVGGSARVFSSLGRGTTILLEVPR